MIFLNSSQSHRIRFMCLSKALKVPIKMRPSCRMHLILKSMCCSILLLFPTVMFAVLMAPIPLGFTEQTTKN